MNRIDRLLAILVLLQRKSRVRAQDLAERFEVSQRTIYRDMAALQEIGVPIIALPNMGYELMEGYSLPPVIFTPEEAGALFLAAHMLIAQANSKIVRHAEHALNKIGAVLPRATRTEVDRLVAIVQFFSERARFNLDDSQLMLLRQAITERQVVFMRYHSYEHNESTEREFEPHQLTYGNHAWYVNGYCRLRRAMRSFRLDRIEELRLLDRNFTMRESEATSAQEYEVRVRFDSDVVRWARERQHYAFVREETQPDSGHVIMIYCVSRLSELQAWLLMWGASAEVLHPPELRSAIREEARRLVEILT